MKKINEKDLEAILFVKIVSDLYNYLKSKNLIDDFVNNVDNLYRYIFNEVENKKELYDFVNKNIKGRL